MDTLSAPAPVLKLCTHCKVEKKSADFPRRRDGALQSWCRKCTADYGRDYIKKNLERNRLRARQWTRDHPEKVAERARRWRLENPEARRRLGREKERRRRAWKAGNGEVETFTDLEICERDRWTCRICGQPVDPSLSFPDPGSRSIDHVKPLVRGGLHTRANVQLAHWKCNHRKGTKMNYKVTKGTVGPWAEGTVITDNDLKQYPGLGGVARLRDNLGVIDDTDEPATGSDAAARAPENTTGSPAKATRKAADAFTGKAPATPNAGGQPPAGSA